MAKAGLLFVGTDDGIVLYSEPGAAKRWFRVGQELRGQAISSVWTWFDDPTIVLAASATVLLRSTDGGMSWAPISAVPGGLLASSKAHSALVTCMTAQGNVFRSSDAGVTWLPIGSLGVAGARIFIATADNQATLYAAAGSQVLASLDQGVAWQVLGELPALVSGLAVLPDHGLVYATAAGQLYQYQAGSWHAIAGPPPLTGPLLLLSGIEPTLLAALDSGEMGCSSDGGATWELAGAEIGWSSGPQALIGAPYHMDVAFAGSSAALAISVDRGRTWQRLKGDVAEIRAIAVARLA